MNRSPPALTRLAASSADRITVDRSFRASRHPVDNASKYDAAKGTLGAAAAAEPAFSFDALQPRPLANKIRLSRATKPPIVRLASLRSIASALEQFLNNIVISSAPYQMQSHEKERGQVRLDHVADELSVQYVLSK